MPHSEIPRIFPSPTLVLGLGRFGLATLERLADDWAGLRLSGGESDPSLRNLRLVWVRPGAGSREEEWRRPEAKAMALARAMGEGDLPSLTLDLVILRTLGLIRYRDGVYQVAVPRDAGVVETAGDGKLESASKRVRRRRFFDWWSLSPDPIAAVERLQRLAERHNELDLFIAPIVNRVRQGHSPRVLLAVISRCYALAQGRDPSPWPWVKKADTGEEGEEREADRRILLSVEELRRHRNPELRDLAPEPLPGWARWEEMEERSAGEESGMELAIPAPFVALPEDPATPFDPLRFLEVDWETTGWASESDGAIRFERVPATDFRFGLFDHDATRQTGHIADLLRSRLRLLARHLDRGLLRLWVDLQRDRVEELDPSSQHRLRQEQLDSALRQSLELLGELLVSPLVSRASPLCPIPAERAAGCLPAEPGPFLSSLFLDPTDGERREDALLERLAELGLASPEETRQEAVPLVRTVSLCPGDGDEVRSDRDDSRSPGLLELRRVLNEETRRVYDFSFLGQYRDRPTRRPPRMTVYVVGDMGEPFTRASFRQVLREVHAELLRAFSPIFEFYREGIDRCLTVTPILWMPHPADPYGGATPEENRCEEAAVIDAVHGIRRWVESVLPASRRRVSQIFVNGRVTDNAVLSLAEAVRQTRDFLSFQMRNEIGRDPWLSRTAAGPAGDDLFSSFSCLEIDFPAERSREYLANRLARSCLAWVRLGTARTPEEPSLEGFEPPKEAKLVEGGRTELALLTGEAAGQMEQEVLARATVERGTSPRQLQAAFDGGMERRLVGRIVERWGELTRGRGRMDDLVDGLRRETSTRLPEAMALVQEHGDQLIQEQAGRGGLQAALAGFQLLRSATGGELQKREVERRRCEDLCRRHRIPEMGAVRSARAAVAAAAVRKPDLPPMKLGLLLAAFLAWPLGAPLAQAIAYLAGADTWPGWILGRFGGLIGGGALWGLAAFLLYRHLDRSVEAVREAIASLAREVRLLFHGRGEPPEKEDRASVRTFFESRLELTAALATRGYSLKVYERAVADEGMAHRLARSLEVQAHALNQNAEDLGVRPAAGRDDLRNLFATQAGESTDRLIGPDRLEELFRDRIGGEEGVGEVAPELIRESGGFGDWRRSACLADRERILRFCRSRFDSVVSTPVGEQALFAEEAGERLCRFVSRAYPNMGFGAKFVGYEGLDPDGISIPACASLVLAPGLAPIFETARRREGAPPTTETLQVTEAQVRPNAAYMLSLVQGIRAHSVRNLRRFESFHDRVHMPDDRTFPLAQEEEHGTPAIINHLSGHRELGERLRSLLETGHE
ncbi:MAG TPA: hypothetical protein VNM67_00215 [Thermoanaerobaculia bacterium]|nr:hypothetical protein [Thermoanaerobaculia bacterium]